MYNQLENDNTTDPMANLTYAQPKSSEDESEMPTASCCHADVSKTLTGLYKDIKEHGITSQSDIKGVKGIPDYIICRPPETHKQIIRFRNVSSSCCGYLIHFALITIVTFGFKMCKDTSDILLMMVLTLIFVVILPPIITYYIIRSYTQKCDEKLRSKYYNPSGYLYQGIPLYRKDNHPHYHAHVNTDTREIRTELDSDDSKLVYK